MLKMKRITAAHADAKDVAAAVWAAVTTAITTGTSRATVTIRLFLLWVGCLLISFISFERQRSPDGALCATYGATPCWALLFIVIETLNSAIGIEIDDKAGPLKWSRIGPYFYS